MLVVFMVFTGFSISLFVLHPIHSLLRILSIFLGVIYDGWYFSPLKGDILVAATVYIHKLLLEDIPCPSA
jgi:hypothetical protein